MAREKIRLVWRKIDELIPYEHNAKLHPPEQVHALVRSFDEFGRIVPAGIDAAGNLIYGHGRILAARERGDTEFPCILIDHLSETQRRAFVHADNLLAQSGTDETVLRAEMSALQAAGFDVTLTGYDPAGLQLGEDGEEQATSENNADEFTAVLSAAEEPHTKRGQIYQLGRHRLMCGDSTDPEDVDLLCSESVGLCLTDPPYGISIVKAQSVGGASPNTIKGATHGAGCGVIPASRFLPITGDRDTSAFLDALPLILKKTKNQIVFGGNCFASALENSPCWVVWDKQNGGSIFADVELAWTSFKTHARIYRWKWNGMIRQGDRNDEGLTRSHPTQKPVGLLSEILNDFSGDEENVFDPFGGSGSTLIACEKTGRTCFMMEIEPYYCDLIVSRWEQYTGQKAVLFNG